MRLLRLIQAFGIKAVICFWHIGTTYSVQVFVRVGERKRHRTVRVSLGFWFTYDYRYLILTELRQIWVRVYTHTLYILQLTLPEMDKTK